MLLHADGRIVRFNQACERAFGWSAGEAVGRILWECSFVPAQQGFALLRAVRELGVHVAIDDFGTGYSSLAYLKHFPIEALKIDRSFVADLGRDSNDAAICAAIIAMGRQLGLKIVAEGVETKEQLQFLATHGCTLAQGFYIAKPVEAPEMAKLLKIGSNDSSPTVSIPMPAKKSGDVPLADYEAEMLLKVAKK